MCGICGIATFEIKPDLKERVMAMRAAIIHRGPDSEGLFMHDNLGLGVRRLSIVDIDGSDQPLYNEDKTVVLVYNGMIYNFKELRGDLISKGHTFSTQGDGEVIVHLYEEYGSDGFVRLEGMFAIALYDLRQGSLYLVRDHIGIKPLYYSSQNNVLCFASEIKAILSSGLVEAELSSTSLHLFFAYNYIPGEGTLYNSILELQPGHFMRRDKNGQVRVERYWSVGDMPDENKNAAVSTDAVIARLDQLMQESIDKHLIADVEVGCFLSGGLDSSTLVHYMEQNPRGKLKTFTVGYDQPSYDERPYAREVTQRYNTEHIEMVCRAEDVIDFLEKLSSLGDSPIGDQAIVSTYLVSKLARKHVKVCLSGDGGDELFLGYPTYHANQIYPYCERLPDVVWRMLWRFLNTFPASDKKVSFDYKAKRFLEGVLMHDQYRAHASWRVIFTPDERKRLFKADRHDGYSAEQVYDRYYSLVNRKQDVQQALAQADFTAWLPNNNLLRTDIFSMSNSLEVRVPLLHLPLVTFVMGLPFQQRFKGSTKKYLLKRLMEPKLGKQIVHRKKEGWHMPLAPWLKAGLFDYCHDIFSSQHHLFHAWLNREYCLQLLNDHKKGLANNTYKIWGVLTLLKLART